VQFLRVQRYFFCSI